LVCHKDSDGAETEKTVASLQAGMRDYDKQMHLKPLVSRRHALRTVTEFVAGKLYEGLE
jgi:hypothetical protein